MRKKKIRGYRRRLRHVQEWGKASLPLNTELLLRRKREYTKLMVHPWSSTPILESVYPEPRGKIKVLMLESLLCIYQEWKKELDKLGQPYYLKIWLYEQRISKSQVVCAIEDNIDFYENLFRITDQPRMFKHDHYGALGEELLKYSWESAFDDAVFFLSEFDTDPTMYINHEEWLYEQRRLRKILKNPRSCAIARHDINDTMFFVPNGFLWIGDAE